jgi:Amidohydrolase family
VELYDHHKRRLHNPFELMGTNSSTVVVGSFVTCPRPGEFNIYNDYVISESCLIQKPRYFAIVSSLWQGATGSASSDACCTELDECGIISAFVPRNSDKGRIILDELSSLTTCKYLPSHSFMLPTFCDLHLHAPQMLYLGTGLHLPLLEWLEKYAYKAEERIDGDLGLASKVYKRLVRRLIESGTGAALVFGTIRTETK